MTLDIQQSEDRDGLDLSEKGRGADGQAIALDRRLFMQLLAFGEAADTAVLVAALEAAGIAGVLYGDINDPYGVGLLTFSEDPAYFLETTRPFFNKAPFNSLRPRPALTMFGRTYAIGYEADLQQTLIDRPIERVTNPETPWGIWYPLRRKGEFANLSAQEQRTILMEHGGIGRAFGRAGYGSDVRLACYGLDQNDNDFVVGLIGPDLYPLSVIVERMRKTKQTSQYLESLGPFFVGRALWQKSRTAGQPSESTGLG